MPKPRRPCLGSPHQPCSNLSLPGEPRCDGCTKALKKLRNDNRTTATAVVEAWTRQYGWMCPGWEREAHPSHDLTSDHVDPLSITGANGEQAVLCRSCNSRKRER